MRWAAVGVIAVLAVGCGGDDATTAETTTTTIADLEVSVTLLSSNGLVAPNIDDVVCEWNKPRYEIRDGDGDIIAAGPLGGVGEVLAPAPNYECRLDETIEVPPADFYDVTLSGDQSFGESWSVTETFAPDEFEAGITATVNP